LRVKCVLCEKIESLSDDKPLAKKLRNRPIHTYMCDSCYERIEARTNERVATGKFQLFREKKQDDDWDF
jgi:uncharacterized protein YlaI